MASRNGTRARPFLRWAGGKARLVHILRRFVPEITDSATYYEPFMGAGSLFLALRPSKAVLGDQNRPLVECVSRVAARPDLVWRALRPMTSLNNEKWYYRFRDEFNAAADSNRKAALFIYLNRTCFNGIWRVNRKGGFNVPFGRRKNACFPTRKGLFHVALTASK